MLSNTIKKKISRKDRDKPWITSHIKYLINERQKKYKEKLQNSVTQVEFNQFRNYVNRQITGSKKIYFDNLFKEIKSNMKKKCGKFSMVLLNLEIIEIQRK